MSRVNEQLANLALNKDDLDDNEVIQDAVIVCSVTRLDDGRSTVYITSTVGTAQVVKVGLMECARQIGAGGWQTVDEDDG